MPPGELALLHGFFSQIHAQEINREPADTNHQTAANGAGFN